MQGRPFLVTAWAVVFGVLTWLSGVSALMLLISRQDSAAAPPGSGPATIALLYLSLPLMALNAVQLWRMSRWALVLYPLGALALVLARTIEQPAWSAQHPMPAFVMPLFLPAAFLACTAPYWRRMSWRFV